MSPSSTIRIGTRGSALARWQAEWVAARLAELKIEVQLVLIQTQGDVKSGPIGAIGTQGVFTKELQRALLDRQIDLAVHSLKDLPTEPVSGLALAAVPPRESTRDVLVARTAGSLETLPAGAAVGTGSLRRQAQLLHARGDLQLRDIRGNVETRIGKLDDGQFDAIVLAEAGLRRLGLAHRITHTIGRDVMLPAVGQGALGLESRADDATTRKLVAPLDDAATHACVRAERAMLAALRGGCLAPVGAWGRLVDDRLQLDGVVLSADGRQRLFAQGEAQAANAAELGQRLAHQLLDAGAGQLIADSRNAT